MSISGSKKTGFLIFIMYFSLGPVLELAPIVVKNCLIVIEEIESKL